MMPVMFRLRRFLLTLDFFRIQITILKKGVFMKKILIGLLVLASSSAFAATTVKSYDMYVPARASFDFVGGLNLHTGTYKFGNTETKYNGVGANFELAYGIMDMLAVYGQQGYAGYNTETGTTKNKTEGLTNTKVGVKGIYGLNNMFFYYDAGLSMALLGKAKVDAAFDPRPALNLLGGFGADIEQFGLGAMLGYDMYMDGDYDNNGTTVKYKSGSGMNWKVYAQYQPSWKVGLSYASATIGKYDIETASQAETQANRISVYGIIPINADSNVFAAVSNYQPKKPTDYDSSAYEVEAKYQMAF